MLRDSWELIHSCLLEWQVYCSLTVLCDFDGVVHTWLLICQVTVHCRQDDRLNVNTADGGRPGTIIFCVH